MISKRIVLRFPHRLVDQPIVYKLVKEYNLSFNILKASITPQEEGLMILELSGDDADFQKGNKYLESAGVRVQLLSEEIIRNSAKCTDCGLCVPICPAGSFTIDPASRKVLFEQDKCIACELCIKICPAHAMEVNF